MRTLRSQNKNVKSFSGEIIENNIKKAHLQQVNIDTLTIINVLNASLF